MMKKTTKKNLMRTLALLMAVIMVATSGAFSSSGWLKATDAEVSSEVDVEEVAEVSEDAEEPEEEQPEDVQGGTEEVEIEIPAEPPVEEPPVEEVVPAVEEAAPLAEEAAPVVEEAAPLAEEAAPVVEEETPVVEEETPVVEEETPVVEEETPVVEEETPVVAKPAAEFSASAGGVKVSVKAPEGAFPEGTTMKVTALSSSEAMALANEASDEDTKVCDAKALDITFYDKDGKEVQPEVEISVKFSNVGLEGSKIEEVNVYHVEDNGNTELVTGNATTDSASFTTDSFSVYIISGETTSKYVEYTFYVNGAEYASQIVKNGDTLYKPATPSNGADDKFLGWYNGETEFTAFGTQDGITADAEVRLDAKFETVYYVFFMDNQDRVYTTKEAGNGETVAADVVFPVAANEAITGWYLDEALTEKVESVTISKSNITLYPKVETGNWMTFLGHGGTYTESVFYAPGTETAAPATPSKSGYVFRHWSTMENGNVAYIFGNVLTEDVELHAVWKANTNTAYTVIHWQENANDDGYSYKEAETKYGTTGNQTSATAKSYSGFTAQTIEQETIEGTGTIVNVYYDRETYNVKFYQYSNGEYGCGKEEHTHYWSLWGGCYDNGKLTCKKEVHSHDSSCNVVPKGWDELTSVRITAKYGADISDQWPNDIASNWGTTKGNTSGQSP